MTAAAAAADDDDDDEDDDDDDDDQESGSKWWLWFLAKKWNKLTFQTFHERKPTKPEIMPHVPPKYPSSNHDSKIKWNCWWQESCISYWCIGSFFDLWHVLVHPMWFRIASIKISSTVSTTTFLFLRGKSLLKLPLVKSIVNYHTDGTFSSLKCGPLSEKTKFSSHIPFR